MEYLLEAFRRVDYIYVGLTQPDVMDLRETPPAAHRGRAYDNPLTYFERRLLIERALSDEGIDRSRFDVIPFPIETPPSLPGFLATHVTCLTTVVEQWNRRKIKILRDLGYPVVVLWERSEKKFHGRDIRDAIRLGDERWRAMVPPATATSVAELDLRERLESLYVGT